MLRRSLLFLLLFLSFLLLFSADWVEVNFGVTSLDSIIFVLKTPITGVPLNMVLSYASLAICAAALALPLSAFILYLRRDFFRPGSPFSKAVMLLPPLLFLGAAANISLRYEALEYFNSETNYSTFIDAHYRAVKPEDVRGRARPRNLILLVLESMENSTHDPRLTSEAITPRLYAIQKNAITFRNHVAGPGANWTIAGLTAYLFGIPLKIPIEENSYDAKFAAFLPGASSLLEVFEAKGYQISVVMGSDSRFSGLNNFFTSHAPETVIYDRSYFVERDPDGGEGMSRWGPPDREVFAAAKEIISQQAEGGGPFLTLIMTMDTHVPGKAFGDYPEPYGDARDSFLTADHMADEFQQWVRKQPFYPDTVIVIMGDHPYMSKSIGGLEIPEGYQRTVYNAFINTGKKPALKRQRAFYSFDMAPTLLEAVGLMPPGGRFGLGVSLFGKERTLRERFGEAELNEGLTPRSLLYDSFFEVKEVKED